MGWRRRCRSTTKYTQSTGYLRPKKEALQMIDQSLWTGLLPFLLYHRKKQEGRVVEKVLTLQHKRKFITQNAIGSVTSNTRPYEVELTRCTTLCLYVRHCSTKSTTTSCLSPCKVRMQFIQRRSNSCKKGDQVTAL